MGKETFPVNTNDYLFQLEPSGLIEAIQAHPPTGFESCSMALNGQRLPAFLAEFDLLLTADEPLRRFIQSAGRILPGKLYSSILRPRTLFIGTTVSEFALFPGTVDAESLPAVLLGEMAERKTKYLIVKDIAPTAPFLSSAENAAAARLCATLTAAGFVLLDGQAMAYIPIDFDSLDSFFSRFSASRRSDFRRKLKKRSAVTLRLIAAGDPMFHDSQTVGEFYRLYENVYNNSYIHFDKLTRPFFEKILRDDQSGGLLFAYSRDDRLIGYSLCFRHGDHLIDKYHGAQYPDFRDNNLYYVSWFDMLQYALDHSLKTAIFGWTDPQIKAYLGSSFVFTRHAVYPANSLLRLLLRRFADTFESDRKTLDDWYASHAKEKR